MVSTLIKKALDATLDKYLDLSDAKISGLGEIKLKNVKIKESAFVDLGLPINCVHGKVTRYFFHLNNYFQLHVCLSFHVLGHTCVTL